MGGPVHVPELDLRRGPVGVHVERERELEQLLPLVPVDVGVDLDRCGRRSVIVCVIVDAPEAARDDPPSAVVDGRASTEVDRRGGGSAGRCPRRPTGRGVAVQLQQVRRARPAATSSRSAAWSTIDVISPRSSTTTRTARSSTVPSPSRATAPHGPATPRRGAGTPSTRVGRPRWRRRSRSPGADEQRSSASRRSTPLQLVGDRGVARARPRGAPRRSTSRAGCRGTAAAAPSARAARSSSYGYVRARADGRGGRPQLGLAQQVLAAPVAALGARLRWCRCRGGSPGTARPTQTGGVRVLGRAPRRRTPRAARARTVGEPSRSRGARAPRRASPGSARRRRRRSRTAPATCWPRPSRRSCARRGPARAPRQLGVVGVDRREVGEDPGAVDALPPERVVREPVGLVPGDLLGEEPARARPAATICGSAAGVAERVGQPDLRRTRRRTRSRKNRLPSTNWRASASPPGMLVSDSTHMPPTGTNRPSATALADAREQLGVVLACIQAYCWADEHGEDEAPGRRPSAAATLANVRAHLADGLAHRPQPGRVDVRVADGDDAVGAGVARAGQHLGQLGAARRGGAGDVVGVEGVERPLQGAQDLGAPREVAGQRLRPARSASRCPAPAPTPSRSSVGELDRAEAVQRVVARGGQVAERGGREAPAAGHVGVGRRLDVAGRSALARRQRRPGRGVARLDAALRIAPSGAYDQRPRPGSPGPRR